MGRRAGRAIRHITRPIERVVRSAGGIFGHRRGGGDDGGGEYIEQIQKIEVILKDKGKDKDYEKLVELGSKIIDINKKENIPKNFSTKDLVEHFDLRR